VRKPVEKSPGTYSRNSFSEYGKITWHSICKYGKLTIVQGKTSVNVTI